MHTASAHCCRSSGGGDRDDHRSCPLQRGKGQPTAHAGFAENRNEMLVATVAIKACLYFLLSRVSAVRPMAMVGANRYGSNYDERWCSATRCWHGVSIIECSMSCTLVMRADHSDHTRNVPVTSRRVCFTTASVCHQSVMITLKVFGHCLVCACEHLSVWTLAPKQQPKSESFYGTSIKMVPNTKHADRKP